MSNDAVPDQGELTGALAEELWGHGHQLDADDILTSLAAAGLVLDIDPDASIWSDVDAAVESGQMTPELAGRIHGINSLHEMIHTAEDDPEDTLFLTLTEREFLVLNIGLLHTGIQHCCMTEIADALSGKMFDIYDVQRAEPTE